MSPSPIFRVAPYSPSTSRITAHQNKAALLHKFLNDQGMAVEPMIEATGSFFLGYLDEEGNSSLEIESDIISFIADATPQMLQPLLQQWLDGHKPAPASTEAAAEAAVAAPSLNPQAG